MMQKKISLVLVHGWGCDNRSWMPLLPYIEYFAEIQFIELPGFGNELATDSYELDKILALIARKIVHKSWICGWSLGGMVAIQLAKKYPQKVAGVVTIASNAKFVADDNYFAAMPALTNKEFNQSFFNNSDTTLKLFSGLVARGAVDERVFLKKIRLSFPVQAIDKVAWYQALQLLSKLDNRQVLKEIHQPCLHLLAEDDALVPVTAAVELQRINSNHAVKIFAQAAHALHWCYPQEVADSVAQFIMQTTQQRLFKQRVARNFSKACGSYDQLSNVQYEAGQKLLQDFASDISLQNGLILDVGAGTGKMLQPLTKMFPSSSIVALDLSVTMLNHAASRQHEMKSIKYIAADAEYLPIADETINLIYSNFALQWCHNLKSVFNEMARCLVKDGEVLITTLVDNSLHELRFAWQLFDQRQHVNQFVTREDFITAISTRFDLIKCEKITLSAEFERVTDLLQSLKGIGATYAAIDQAEMGLTGRRKIEKLTEAYESFRKNGSLPLTYDILFVRARKHE